MDSRELQDRLDFALAVSGQAARLVLRYYQSSGLRVWDKTDQTPVTDADRGAEELLRQAIERRFPDDGVFGEEFGQKEGRSRARWILDPIDGTKAFVHGVPLFGTLVGLQWDGEPVLGVCRFPALDEVVFAARGQGAWWQRRDDPPRRITVSTVRDLANATVCYTELQGWQRTDRTPMLLRLCQEARLVRGWGDCYGHMLVATGRAELMLDPLLNEWDAAALIPIVREAGGHFLDWNGRPTNGAGNGISVNEALKETLVRLLAR